jgi:hypothetical protein
MSKSKRAYSASEVLAKKHTPIPWEGIWKSAFGNPDMADTWFVMGASASGKSSFVMQLARELCNHGKVHYLSLEEGIGQSFAERLKRFGMDTIGSRFQITTEPDMDELVKRLSKQRSAKFIIIDSFQYTGWTYPQVMALIERFPKRCFIFISQEDRGQPIGKSAVKLRYAAGVKVKVSGFKAYCQGRYTGEAGSFYPVWEEGINRIENGIKP